MTTVLEFKPAALTADATSELLDVELRGLFAPNFETDRIHSLLLARIMQMGRQPNEDGWA
jgi:hypothetical protein